jgi:hypothetical protein
MVEIEAPVAGKVRMGKDYKSPLSWQNSTTEVIGKFEAILFQLFSI